MTNTSRNEVLELWIVQTERARLWFAMMNELVRHNNDRPPHPFRDLARTDWVLLFARTPDLLFVRSVAAWETNVKQRRMTMVLATILFGFAIAYGADQRQAVAPAEEEHDATLGAAFHDGNALRPCSECLSATAAVEVARIYLDRAEIDYIGEPRAELLEGFPWHGGKGLRWMTGDIPEPWSGKKRTVTYVGERRLASDIPNTPSPDQTWRIWYQTGWLAFDRIKLRVDNGTLPLEALAWPPIKREKSFLIHSRTGEFAMTRDDMIDEESEAFYKRHERAKMAARAHAEELLRTPEGRLKYQSALPEELNR